jgi:hypothetical protein
VEHAGNVTAPCPGSVTRAKGSQLKLLE